MVPSNVTAATTCYGGPAEVGYFRGRNKEEERETVLEAAIARRIESTRRRPDRNGREKYRFKGVEENARAEGIAALFGGKYKLSYSEEI